MSKFRGLIAGQQVDFESKLTSRGLEATMVTVIDCDRKTLSKTKQPKKIRCFNCGEFTSHLASECDQSPQPKKCHHCKSEDHLIADCPLRVACLLLDAEEESNRKSLNDSTKESDTSNDLIDNKLDNKKKELNDEIKLTENVEVKSKLADHPPSVEQDQKQNIQDAPNSITNKLVNQNDSIKNVLIEKDNHNFLNKTTKNLINYKKLTKKIKRKQTSTSSLSNASFSSSSSEISSSSIPSQSVSPCSFSYSNQANYSPNYVASSRQDPYLNQMMNNQMIDGQFINNHVMTNQALPELNYSQDQLGNYQYYDQNFDCYLPVSYRLNQPTYNYQNDRFVNPNTYSSTSTNLPFFKNSLPTSQLTNSSNPLFKVCSSPYVNYENNYDFSSMNTAGHLSNQDPIMNQHYLNSYQPNNQFTSPVSSQSMAYDSKFIYSNQSICLNNGFNNLNSNSIRNCNCSNHLISHPNSHSFDHFIHPNEHSINHSYNQLTCEEKLRMNHQCCKNKNQCTNHHPINCHHNQIMNHNTKCCRFSACGCSNDSFNCCTGHNCNHDCSNYVNYINHHHDSAHHHDSVHHVIKNNLSCHLHRPQTELDVAKLTCCNHNERSESYLKTNLISNQLNSSVTFGNNQSACEMQDASTKKVLDQFETDSGIVTRCNSTANGSLEIE